MFRSSMFQNTSCVSFISYSQLQPDGAYGGGRWAGVKGTVDSGCSSLRVCSHLLAPAHCGCVPHCPNFCSVETRSLTPLCSFCKHGDYKDHANKAAPSFKQSFYRKPEVLHFWVCKNHVIQHSKGLFPSLAHYSSGRPIGTIKQQM